MFWKRRKKEQALELGKENFLQKIKSKKVSLVFFEAPWCGACKMLHPIINELADENRENENIMISIVNTDHERELSQEFSIRTLPTLCIFRDGKLFQQGSGMISKPRLQEMIDNFDIR